MCIPYCRLFPLDNVVSFHSQHLCFCRLKVVQLDVTDDSQINDATKYVTEQLHGQGELYLNVYSLSSILELCVANHFVLC